MKKLTILIALTLLAACTPKRNSTQAQTNVATIAGQAIGTQCVASNNTASVGTIYDNQGSFNFEAQVKALLSATISPNEIGSISPQGNAQTGVRFNGLIKLDASGNVVPAQSRLTISVYDSIWLSNQTASNLIQVIFDPSKGSTISGQFNLTSGDGALLLKDQYGEVRFQGKIDAQNFSGTVSFQNSVSVVGGSPASGTLGQFFIQRCAILQ